ncbi:MAG: acyl-CoA dehydrogenase family protein [Clostridia bacterium]|nr:acyl-CoA dehydrogenase family protein [Clostridia bacterium]
MHLELTEEQKGLRAMARRFADQVVAPRAAAIDESEEYPEDIFQAMREAGLFGVSYPPEYGGSGGGVLGLALVMEEVSRHCQTSASILIESFTPGLPIRYFGTAEQRRHYLTGLATGSLRACIANTEPDAGSDAASIRTRAVREGDEVVISGRKCFISNAPVADFAVVTTKTDPAAGGRGITMFVVPMKAPGVSIGKLERKMGVRGLPDAEVIFDGVRVPATHRVGEEGQGLKVFLQSINANRPIVGARGVGIAQGALDYAIRYAKERIQFGQPITSFQATQFKVADCQTRIDAARLLVWRAAFLADQGRVTDPDCADAFAMAKLYASEVAVEVVNHALQIMGGYGYMRDHPIERHYRDARLLPIILGTSEIQRLIIARTVLSRF